MTFSGAFSTQSFEGSDAQSGDFHFPLNVMQLEFQQIGGPTNGRAVLRSKLVDGRCQVQSPVAHDDLVGRSFLWFSGKFA